MGAERRRSAPEVAVPLEEALLLRERLVRPQRREAHGARAGPRRDAAERVRGVAEVGEIRAVAVRL